MSRIRLLSAFALAGMCAFAFSGCNALNSNQLSQWNNGTPGAAAAAPGQVFTVQLHGDSGKPESKQVAIEGEAFVQQVLEKSGALKRFRRMNIDVVRTSPQGNHHKMAVAFDRGKRQVESHTNYFLHPGDVIIVSEDSSTILDDMFEGITGSKTSNAARRFVSG